MCKGTKQRSIATCDSLTYHVPRTHHAHRTIAFPRLPVLHSRHGQRDGGGGVEGPCADVRLPARLWMLAAGPRRSPRLGPRRCPLASSHAWSSGSGSRRGLASHRIPPYVRFYNQGASQPHSPIHPLFLPSLSLSPFSPFSFPLCPSHRELRPCGILQQAIYMPAGRGRGGGRSEPSPPQGRGYPWGGGGLPA